MIQHTTIPMSEIMFLIVNPETARINADSTQMMAVIGTDMHILTGDFEGIETATDLEEIIKKNLTK